MTILQTTEGATSSHMETAQGEVFQLTATEKGVRTSLRELLNQHTDTLVVDILRDSLPANFDIDGVVYPNPGGSLDFQFETDAFPLSENRNHRQVILRLNRGKFEIVINEGIFRTDVNGNPALNNPAYEENNLETRIEVTPDLDSDLILKLIKKRCELQLIVFEEGGLTLSGFGRLNSIPPLDGSIKRIFDNPMLKIVFPEFVRLIRHGGRYDTIEILMSIFKNTFSSAAEAQSMILRDLESISERTIIIEP